MQSPYSTNFLAVNNSVISLFVNNSLFTYCFFFYGYGYFLFFLANPPADA